MQPHRGCVITDAVSYPMAHVPCVVSGRVLGRVLAGRKVGVREGQAPAVVTASLSIDGCIASSVEPSLDVYVYSR